MAGNPQMRPIGALPFFASPDQLDPQLQLFLEDASTRLCKWLGDASNRGPLPSLSVLPGIAPSQYGLSSESLLEDLQLVMDGAYQPSHPGALAHLDPPPLTGSIIADLICAGLNNNLLADELSPSLSRLERDLCRWFAGILGLPKSAGGVAASGGSLSNLMALVIARQQADFQEEKNLFVIASSDAHVSLSKALRVMGLSSNALQAIPTDSNGQISLSVLEKRLKTLKSQGLKCFAVVATAGTTVRGAIDPLISLAKFCAQEKIWLHVDGAIGGVFALSEKTSPMLEGLSKANSVTVNPQKVLGIAKTSSLLLVAEKNHLFEAFSTGLPYMEPAWGEAHGGELGIQGTRSAEVLKLWLGLRQLGEEGIQKLLIDAISRRNYFQRKLERLNVDFVTGPLHLIAFTPKGLDEDEASQWTMTTRKNLLDNQFMLSRCLYKGRHYLKVVLGNPHTQLDHLDMLEKFIKKYLTEL